MIVDEIQTGFARTGEWFGFQHAGVSPDVVTLAKAMGNGMPVGACWARRDHARSFEPGDHGSTYSATALATAAVVAVLSEMRRLDAPALARTQGRRLREHLEALPGVASVRGAGLLLGRRARRRSLLGRCLRGVAGSRPHHQRRHPDEPAPGTAPHRHRRRDRRGGRPDRSGARLRRCRTECVVTRHLLDVTDVDADEVATILDLAEQPIAELGRPLEGLGAALVFEKPSNRTRHSMEMAVVQLGGHPVYTRGEEVGFDVREPVEDVARILAGYHALIAARVFDHHVLTRMAAAAVVDVPVVNCSRITRIPSRRSPTHSRCASTSARWPIAPLPGSATTTTSPARSVRSPRRRVCTCGSRARRGSIHRRRNWPGSRPWALGP
jgi:hypothetical protein